MMPAMMCHAIVDGHDSSGMDSHHSKITPARVHIALVHGIRHCGPIFLNVIHSSFQFPLPIFYFSIIHTPSSLHGLDAK